jgi:PEP-CTERM motif
MTSTTSRRLLQLLAVCSMIIVFSATSQAGILSGHGAAYGGITGTVPFNNGIGLSGTIDYAVFTASDFNANFGGSGYVPGDALVYTYQVEVTGSLGVSAELIGVNNPANTIGTFNIGDQDALSASFTPNARWLFSPEIPTGMSSWGLAFSSPNVPIVGASLTIDGGTQALVPGVPTPGPIALVPEPASLLLLAGGVVVSCLSRRARV